ncbi:gamma-aminobutyric acid type B receptor subunit 2-like isoform X1 [Montipora capricornis]|uniref:gamma-aminobutyric acid type B receptor subunit 2-like isoform X1 n=1 Tax=Montipora capricornis TaxID=246305 RepID=UPI0035F115DF
MFLAQAMGNQRSFNKQVQNWILVPFFVCLFMRIPRQALANEEKKTLTIGGLYATGSITTFQNASGIIETVNKALQFINERSQILPGYKLQIRWADTKCQLGHGVQALFQHIKDPPTKIMLLGGICSAATTPIAECSQLLNLIQVAYGASSFYLSDKKKYPLFFRTIPPEKGQNRVRLAILQHFKWNRIAILTEKEPYYEAAFTSLIELLEKHNITIVAKAFLNGIDEEDHRSPIKTFQDKDARVIVGLFSEKVAVKVFCQAYKQGFYGGKYVWLLIGWYQPSWWKDHTANASKFKCKPKHVAEAFGNYIMTAFRKVGPSSPNIIGGKKTHSWWENNVNRLGQYSGFAYDAMVSIALALNRSAAILASRNKTLDEFNYEDAEMAQIFKESLSTVKFQGFTGQVYYNKEGERKGIVEVGQKQGNEIKILGNYTVLKEELALESAKFIWQGGKIPADQMTTVNKQFEISLGLFGFFCAADGLGIIIAVAFLTFNINNSEHRYIKMSSPRMNNIIVVGAILIYISGILISIDGRNFVGPGSEVIIGCRFSSWVACIGFTLGFGGMFLKTWRVHKIFVNRTKKVVISDYHLLAMLALFISIDLLIIVIREVIDPQKVTQRFTGNEEYDSSKDTKYVPYYNDCTSSYRNAWLYVFYGYKGIMLAFGVFLAWETRSVCVPGLNDSRYIGLSIYNVVFPCALGMTVISIVKDVPDVRYVVQSVLVVFCTTVTLCLVFIPKISTVKADPLGQNTPRFVPSLINNQSPPQGRAQERRQLQPTAKTTASRPTTRSTPNDRQRANSNLS